MTTFALPFLGTKGLTPDECVRILGVNIDANEKGDSVVNQCTWVQHCAQLVEDSFLDDPALVHAAAQLLKVDLGLDVLLQLRHNPHVHIALQQRSCDFLYECIK